MHRKALLVIDMQYGIFMRKHYDGMAVYDEENLLANVRSLLAKARGKGAPVIYIQHTYGPEFPGMERGSQLWDIHPDIAPEAGDIRIEKRHADAFHESALKEELDRLGITHLVITGVQSGYCVDTTCRRALSLGYQNTLVADGHGSLDEELLPGKTIVAYHNALLGSQFADVRPAKEVEF